MNFVLLCGVVLLFCIDYFITYKGTVNRNKDLTEKQRAHILSIKASITLFILSMYFNYKFMKSGFDLDLYKTNIENGDNFVVLLSVCNLIAYFITDCYIGYRKYNKYMCTLAGYPHHIIYIFISIYALFYDASSFYLLFMVEELPTTILSTGNYNKILRKDYLFGFTFFCVRILYHLYLVFKFSANKLYLILGIVSFGVHSFWFKNWFTKYFLQSKDKIKVTKKKKSE
jgi:hypothetical protein